MKPVDYTYYTYVLIFRRLKRVGSVLSRSELDPFLYISHGIIQFGPKTGLAPVVITHLDFLKKCYTLHFHKKKKKKLKRPTHTVNSYFIQV